MIHPSPNADPAEKDPVCGMKVVPGHSKGGTAWYDGKAYYFCNPKCRDRFVLDALKYLGPRRVPVAVPAPGVEYTCPMDPQIVRAVPGSCPICGMALEPRTLTLDEPPNPELVQMSRRFFVCVGPAAATLLLSMSDLLPGAPLQRALGASLTGWLQFSLATPVVLWGGWPFFQRAFESVVHRRLNMFTLIGLGTGVAWCFSVFALLFPGALPGAFHAHGAMAPLYFEAAAVITTLVLLGQMLELGARGQTASAIRALLGLAPKNATASASATRRPRCRSRPSGWEIG